MELQPVQRVAVGLTVTVPDDAVELNVGYLPWVLGDSLAAQVHAHERRERLGYYPALENFRDPATGIDPALLALVDEVAQFSVDYARRELRRHLSRMFAGVEIRLLQCTAYALPRARPGRPQALAELGRHYSPARVRVELLLAVVDKIPISGLEERVTETIRQWDHAPFAALEVTGCRRLAAALAKG